MGNGEKSGSVRSDAVSAIRRLPLLKSLMFLYNAGKILVRFGSCETGDEAQRDLIAKNRPEQLIDIISLVLTPQPLNWFRAMYLVEPQMIAQMENLLNDVFMKGFEAGIRQEKLRATQPPPIPRNAR